MRKLNIQTEKNKTVSNVLKEFNKLSFVGTGRRSFNGDEGSSILRICFTFGV